MLFQMAALALTWSDLERSKSRSRIFRRAVTWKRSQIGPCYFFPLSNSILPYSLSLSPNQIRVRDGIANWAPGPVASSYPIPQKGNGILFLCGFIFAIIIIIFDVVVVVVVVVKIPSFFKISQ